MERFKRRRKNAPITVEWLKSRTITNDRGCWIWQCSLSRKGYGEVGYQCKTWKATRMIWTLIHGPIPDGLHVLHDCDVKACINPDHLHLGTPLQNTAEAISRGLIDPSAMPKGEQCSFSKLTDEDVIFIRQSPLVRQILAAMFSVSKRTISDIRLRRRWKHI